MATTTIRALGVASTALALAACIESPFPREDADSSDSTPTRLDARISAPWKIREQSSEKLLLQLGETPDGVRVDLDRQRSGITIIADGRTLLVDEATARWPLLRPAFKDVDSAEVFVDGPDLVVRFRGPPLTTLTDHPAAPGDPAIAWIRIRPRAADWRVAVEGLFTLSLPNSNRTVSAIAENQFRVDSNWGEFELTTDTIAAAHATSATRWSYTTAPALAHQRPYERVGFTWRR